MHLPRRIHMVSKWLSLIVVWGILCSCVTIQVIEPETSTPDRAYVSRVVDGDTIELENGEKVRFVGINTPEKWEFYYEEATQGLRDLVENTTVDLERDVSDRDKYGRLLRYVYLKNGTLVNAVMVDKGFAKAYHYPPDTGQYELFLNLEEQAKSEGIGIWNETARQAEPGSSYPEDCLYVASKSGEVYYSVTCKYANRILVENRICFETEEEVVDAGYRLTQKC